MQLRIFSPETRSTINWAGGTSTEIFIYPASGSFTDRNFLFRISTATVEVEESTFTFFEGITRHLMILKGELELTHVGRYTKHLKPFDQDIFSGEWQTQSKGKVTDFNLMLKGGATGSLKHHRLEANQNFEFSGTSKFYFLYFAGGTGSLSNEMVVSAGDLIQLSGNAGLTVGTDEGCDVIEIIVELPTE